MATVGTPDHNNGCLRRSPLTSHTTTQGFDRPTVRHKDHPTGVDQAHREPNPSNPQSYGTPTSRNPHIINQALMRSRKRWQ